MIIDLASGPARGPLEYDLCILGAGAAGLTLANELSSSTNAKILLVESGNFQLDAPTQQLYGGESGGTFLSRKKNLYLTSSRLRFFGGTTNHWTGWVYPFDDLDFEKRSWVPHSGWPFARSELMPYYERARTFLKLPTLIQEDIPPAERTPSFLDSISDFQERVFQICPRRLGPDLRSDLESRPNLTMLLNANVTGVISNKGGRTVSGVKVKSLVGNEATVRAHYFVLACGGIENARILLASTDGGSQGLGNEHGLVGRFFSDHPHAPLAYVAMRKTPLAKRYRESFFDSLGLNLLSVLHLKSEVSQRERLLNCTVQLQNMKRTTIPVEMQQLGLALARDGQKAPQAPSEEDILSVFVRFEQFPNPQSRVTLGAARDALGMPRAQLVWDISAADLGNARHTVEILMRNLGRLGVGRLLSRVDGAQSWPANARGGNHHMGTTRMHMSPTQGVVDENCRLHSRENFFIAGSSVFPTTSSVNPTLTILALAFRLAQHLKDKLP